MIAEREDAIKMFFTADANLEEHMRPQRERHGITSEWIEGHPAAALARASARVAASSDLDLSMTGCHHPTDE